MKQNHPQAKKAGLTVRSNLRGGAYFSITLGVGGGAPGAPSTPATPSAEPNPVAA